MNLFQSVNYSVRRSAGNIYAWAVAIMTTFFVYFLLRIFTGEWFGIGVWLKLFAFAWFGMIAFTAIEYMAGLIDHLQKRRGV